MINLIRSIKDNKDGLIEFKKIKDKYTKKIFSNSKIVAYAVNDKEIILLDKEYSLLRIFNTHSDTNKTIGSRLGYVSNKTKGRIGFEFPEDLLIIDDKLIISDSGNNRLQVLSKEYELIKNIHLPDSPYKFIHNKGDLIIVSDFFRSVFFISLKYGFIGKIKLDEFIDFSTILIDKNISSIKDEDGINYNFVFKTSNVYEIAEYFDNKRTLMGLLFEKSNKRDQIRSLIVNDCDLILEYIDKTGDNFFDKIMSEYIKEKIYTVFSNDSIIIKDIEKLSLEYLYIYKILNSRGDQESGSLIKEQKIFSIFEKIKFRRSKFEEILKIKNSVSKNKFLNGLCKKILSLRQTEIEIKTKDVFSKIESEMDKLEDEKLLKTITIYWLLYDEIKKLFPDLRKANIEIPVLTNVFYNQILKDFYFNMSKLFLKSNQLEQFYSFAEKELALYSDKISIMFKYTDILISQNNFDRALNILDRSVDKNKENLNHRYYRIYKGKNEPQIAFEFLKKEIELFPHKKELIPELLSFNLLSKDELSSLINDLEENGEQIIDANFNTAMVLLEIGNEDKAEFFLNKELELFPENKKALLLKMKRMLKQIPNISEEEGVFNFKILINFLNTISDETNILEFVNYFSVLNFIPYSKHNLDKLNSINIDILPDSFKYQIETFLSFVKYIKEEKTEENDAEIYLVANSTSFIAFNHYFMKAKRYINESKEDKGLELIEKILKYNPGNQEIFSYLNTLTD